MKKTPWVRKTKSFGEAEEMDWNDYRSMTPSERLSILQDLREKHEKFGGVYANRKRLRRIARVIKQA